MSYLRRERHILVLQIEALRRENQQAYVDLEEQFQHHQQEVHELREESLQVTTAHYDFLRVSSPKNKKMMSLMTHPRVVPSTSELRSSSEHSLRCFRFSPRAFCPSIGNVYGILSVSRKKIKTSSK